MSEKTTRQYARDTLNALIAGGHVPRKLVFEQGRELVIDQEALRSLEEQLREYHLIDITKRQDDFEKTRGITSED